MAVETPVLLDQPEVVCGQGDKRVRLRAGVLRLGGMLGWEPREVISFAEAVAGCPWRHFGSAEFEMVLEEYRTIAHALRAKTKRPVDHAMPKAIAAPGDGYARCD